MKQKLASPSKEGKDIEGEEGCLISFDFPEYLVTRRLRWLFLKCQARLKDPSVTQSSAWPWLPPDRVGVCIAAVFSGDLCVHSQHVCFSEESYFTDTALKRVQCVFNKR